MRHHFVPQFWLRLFADRRGNVHCREAGIVKIVSTRDIMQIDGLYTRFNNKWQASDALEQVLGRMEARAAPLFARLDDPSVTLTDADAGGLISFLALQACRHPDVLARGHRRAREMAEVFADVHDMSQSAFVARLSEFGLSASEAQAARGAVLRHPAEVLLAQFDEVLTTSPQDEKLPSTDAIYALPLITALLAPICWEVLQAPPGHSFLLGDTPLPQSNLAAGLRVPISARTAVVGIRNDSAVWISRAVATSAQITSINQEQFNDAAKLVVAADPALLQALKET